MYITDVHLESIGNYLYELSFLSYFNMKNKKKSIILHNIIHIFLFLMDSLYALYAEVGQQC